ncbi:MAG: uroporphyrinogen III decarboxylase [Melioribacteraceae bacterium]|nr:MAG: uroporphyrinogen III decarboxylase [Melioribacteraceae bacterium]
MFRDKRKRDFGRLVNTLRGGKTDCVPLIELGIHPIVKEALLGHKINSVNDDVKFMDMMGYDFVKIQPIINYDINFGAASGNQQVDRAWAPEQGGVIASREDFENYRWLKIEDVDYSRFEQVSDLPEGMGIIGQYGDIFTLAWELMGFENFAMASFTDPELVKDVFTKVEEVILSMFESMAQMDNVGVLWYSDDIAYSTGLMMSPDFYRELFFPMLAKIGKLAAEHQKPFIYHTDGLLFEVMEDIIGSGVNALHPIEPKAMDISELKTQYSDRISFCGGIDVDILARGSTEDVRRLTLSFMEKAMPEGGWCAGSSNSVPDYVPVENYITMVQTIIENGDY